jgi:anti-sigma factor RsiW
MRICDWCDKYRDDELNAEERSQFEKHLSECKSCSENLAILNSFVHALTSQELQIPSALPERIARRAFQKSGSWDFLVTSWIRPAPAWYAFAVALIVLSILWAFPSISKTNATSDYETLMMESNPANTSASAAQALTDEDMANWLRAGGSVQ